MYGALRHHQLVSQGAICRCADSKPPGAAVVFLPAAVFAPHTQEGVGFHRNSGANVQVVAPHAFPNGGNGSGRFMSKGADSVEIMAAFNGQPVSAADSNVGHVDQDVARAEHWRGNLPNLHPAWSGFILHQCSQRALLNSSRHFYTCSTICHLDGIYLSI